MKNSREKKLRKNKSGFNSLMKCPSLTSYFTSTFVLEPEAEPSTTVLEVPPTPQPTDEEAESVISIISSTMGSILTDSPISTSVEFSPDKKIFTNFEQFNKEIISDRLRELAYLTNITFEISETLENGELKTTSYHYPGGISS